LIPNPNTADTNHPQIYDYWPICYDPDHFSQSDWNTFNADHAGWGAAGGLREAAFVDEFGVNGLKFSICQRDFSSSMKVIGDAIAKHLQNLCVDYKLLDKDTTTQDLQPDCRVVWRIPGPDPNNPNKIVYAEDPTSMPECEPGMSNTNRPSNTFGDCWQLTNDPVKCPINGQLINIVRTAEHVAALPQLLPGTKVGMQCRTCTDDIPGMDPNSEAYKACHY
jgi:hypothetical protein